MPNLWDTKETNLHSTNLSETMQQERPDNFDTPSTQSAELFNLIIGNIKDYAVFMLDIERRIVSWNPGVERLLGYTEIEFVGQSGDIIFTPEDIAAGVPVKEMEIARANDSAEDKRWHRRRDGGLFWANGMMMSLKNEDGAVRGFAKVMRDETAQKRFASSRRTTRSSGLKYTAKPL